MQGFSYLDTSFLLKAYKQEPGSIQVLSFLKQNALTACVSVLTDVEMASALFRQLSSAEAQRSYSVYRRNRQSGTYIEAQINEDVFALARRIAEQHSGALLLRSLDLLHLATALHQGATSFATYDGRLGTAAQQLGLSVIGARP